MYCRNGFSRVLRGCVGSIGLRCIGLGWVQEQLREAEELIYDVDGLLSHCFR